MHKRVCPIANPVRRNHGANGGAVMVFFPGSLTAQSRTPEYHSTIGASSLSQSRRSTSCLSIFSAGHPLLARSRSSPTQHGREDGPNLPRLSSATRSVLCQIGGPLADSSDMATRSIQQHAVALLVYPCFLRRVCGVPGGNDTQGWRDSSHTAMAGGGKFGSARLPMATATYPGKPSPSQYTVEPQVGQK